MIRLLQQPGKRQTPSCCTIKGKVAGHEDMGFALLYEVLL